MKVLLATFARDEGDLLAHFVHHYRSEIDSLLIYNDGSTDGSIKKARELYRNINVMDLENVPREWQEFLVYFTQLRNNTLHLAREQDFDVVVIVDSDEFLSAPMGFSRLRSFIEWFEKSEFAGVRAIGFDVIGEDALTPEEVALGSLSSISRNVVRYSLMDKPCIFSTRRCTDLIFQNGAHFAHIEAPGISTPWAPLSPSLFHYKFLSLEFARARINRDNRTLSDEAYSAHKSHVKDIDFILRSIKGC